MREQIDFTNRVVLITGGASGIGRGIADEFAAEGAHIAIADINEEAGEQAASELTEQYNEALFVPTDVSDYDDCVNSVERVLDRFGQIDVLVNSAAGEIGDRSKLIKPFQEEEPADWEPQLQVTFKGPLAASRAVVPHMTERGTGSIINIVSESRHGRKSKQGVYASAKSAVVTFTKCLAKEVGPDGVRVNAVSPSATWTPATEEWLENEGDDLVEDYPLGRLGRPEDTANAAVFLASDAAAWITGETLSVNGGAY